MKFDILLGEMHEGERHLGRSNTWRAEQGPVGGRWNIVKNSILPIAALGAAGIWSVAVARLITPADAGDVRQIIREMQADPSKYPQFNRVFNLQDHLPANPEISDCH